jgi:hypothetical protein
MSKQRSILFELDNLVPKQNRGSLVESRATNVITSAHYLMEMIQKNYDEELAEQIQKRLLSAIKSGNVDKFSRYISRLSQDDE